MNAPHLGDLLEFLHFPGVSTQSGPASDLGRLHFHSAFFKTPGRGLGAVFLVVVTALSRGAAHAAR